MAVGDAHVFPGFLIPVLTQLSFQSHKLLFSHASVEGSGENRARKKGRLNQISNSQPPGHTSHTLITEPPRGRSELLELGFVWLRVKSLMNLPYLAS